jgi:protein O-mannosyl-transferase
MPKSDKMKPDGRAAAFSQTPLIRDASSTLLGLAVLLFIVTRCFIAFVLDPTITDVISPYYEYATSVVDRQQTPYRDFTVEYPPVSWWSIAGPRLLDGRRLSQDPNSPADLSIKADYHRAYRLEMALCDLISFMLFVAIVRRRRPRLAGLAALTYVVTSAILCHVLYDHLDEGTLLFSMLGAYAWVRSLDRGRMSLAWSGAAMLFLGLGFSHKLMPLVAAPFLLLGGWRGPDRWRRTAVGVCGLLLGVAGPFAIQYAVSGPGVFALFGRHARREIQVESLYSTLMWIGSLFGNSVSVSLFREDRSCCIFGDGAGAMKTLSTVLLCGFLGGTWLWAALRRARFGKNEALAVACYTLGACVVFSKVLSPQYFVWSIPMLLLAAVEALPEEGSPRWVLTGLLVIVAGLTTWLFPYHYFCAPLGPGGSPSPYGLVPASPEESLAPSSLAYLVLALRNFLYLGIVVWLGTMLLVGSRARNAVPDDHDELQPLPASQPILWLSPSTWVKIAVLVVLTTAIYLPALGGGVLLDDDLLLTQNKIVKASDGLYQFWFTAKAADYWPVTNTTFWIEWRLWGERLAGYHVTNLLLHVVESLLIWGLLWRLRVPGAFWGALLFAVHPVNVESVAWIASRKNLVAMFFFLLSLWWYLKSEERPAAPQNARAKKAGGERSVWARATDFSRAEFAGRWYWLSLAAFMLAMLGKGSVAVMPGLLLCVLWWKRPIEWRDARRVLPFFAVAAGLASLNVWFQTHDTEKIIRHADLVERVLAAGAAVWFYLYKAVWPFDLAFVYPSWHVTADRWLWWLPLLAAIAATAVLFVAAKPWRAARNWFCPFWFAWLFFVVALLPVLGFFDVGFMKYALVADRYLHVALLAVVALAASVIGKVRLRLPVKWRAAAVIAAAAVVAVFSLVSWRQSGLYIDRYTLFRAANEKNADSWMIHDTLGVWELNQNRPAESVAHFRRALDLCPPQGVDCGHIHEHYGHALVRLGQTEEAVRQWELAVAAGWAPPRVVARLRETYRQSRDVDKLLALDSRLVELSPDSATAHYDLGVTLAQTGHLDRAIEQYRLAIKLDPQHARALNNLGAVYYRRREIKQAVDCYQRALQCQPDYAEAHYNLGGLLYQMDAIPEAIAHLEAAVRLKPDYASALFILAKSYQVAHQDQKAVAAATKAFELARANKQDRAAAEIEAWLEVQRRGGGR